MMPLIMIFLIVFAGVFNALMDWGSESKFNSSYWNKNVGWRYKYYYKNGKFKKYSTKWYNFGYKPRYAEKFPLSTTVFVFLTDGWHLLQFLFHSTWQVAISLTVVINGNDDWHYKLITFIIIKTIFSASFEIIYRIRK